MSELLALGVSHKTAPLDLRERLSLTEGRAVAALRELTEAETITEAAACGTPSVVSNIAGHTDAVADGLALISAVPSAMLVAFSTAPGGWSKQGTGDNSPYAEALAAALKSKGKNVEQIFKLARARVVVATAGEQIPWEKSSLVQNVMFVPEVNQPAVVTPEPVRVM